jgi:hypothetical protein
MGPTWVKGTLSRPIGYRDGVTAQELLEWLADFSN